VGGRGPRLRPVRRCRRSSRNHLLAPLVAAVTAISALAAPVLAGGSPASQAPVTRHGAGPFSGALNVIMARSVRSRLGTVMPP
jgi:hypothetical protein